MQLSGKRPSLVFRSVNRIGQPGHNPGLQRHHLLPLQMIGIPSLGNLLNRLGLDRLGMHDFRRNGLLLPAREDAARRIGLPLHRGPHRSYSEMVMERSGQIEAGWNRARKASPLIADRDALMRFDLLQRALRRRLLDPARWSRCPLNRRDPALDFSNLDAMAELLWGTTQPNA